MRRRVVVVGTSVAGVRVAQALRRVDFDGEVTLVGAEPEEPYDKPPLSKQFLAGTWGRDRITLLTTEQATRLGIMLRLGVAAQGLDPVDKVLRLADGTVVAYDVAVLASGASARWPTWAQAPGVHVVRTLADSCRLRSALAEPGRVVVVGGGFIGAEVAATARALGHEVVVVDPLEVPMGRVLGPTLGAALVRLHEAHGVVMRVGVGVVAVGGRPGHYEVMLDDGTVLDAAVVVVGVGAQPEAGWLAGSGAVVDAGVVCDAWGRVAGIEDVFAAGDVASWRHVGRQQQVRFEHWTNAAEQAGIVAAAIVDPDRAEPYRPVEYVWSDQYDWKVQLAGRPGDGPSWRMVGALSGPAVRAAVVAHDRERLLGVATVNWPSALAQARRALSDGLSAPAFADRLERAVANPGVPTAS
jgi:NADPH-dependent 2,4-dienoyl-CoA reductase/sulfur reductase-like enzyme